jgi:hypothetical protein
MYVKDISIVLYDCEGNKRELDCTKLLVQLAGNQTKKDIIDLAYDHAKTAMIVENHVTFTIKISVTEEFDYLLDSSYRADTLLTISY